MILSRYSLLGFYYNNTILLCFRSSVPLIQSKVPLTWFLWYYPLTWFLWYYPLTWFLWYYPLTWFLWYYPLTWFLWYYPLTWFTGKQFLLHQIRLRLRFRWPDSFSKRMLGIQFRYNRNQPLYCGILGHDHCHQIILSYLLNTLAQ
jgi:hypothetical protein